jgi:hypothetical protein
MLFAARSGFCSIAGDAWPNSCGEGTRPLALTQFRNDLSDPIFLTEVLLDSKKPELK